MGVRTFILVKKHTYYDIFLLKNLEVKEIFCYFAPEIKEILYLLL